MEMWGKNFRDLHPYSHVFWAKPKDGSLTFFAQGSNDDEDKEHHWSFCHMLSLSKMVCI
jgi:hypothetical protein